MVAKLAALSRRCRSARGGSSVSSIIRSTYVPSAVPSAGFEHALTALEGNPVRDNYLVKHVVPVWLGTFGGSIPGEPAGRRHSGPRGVPRRRVQIADVQEARCRYLGVDVIYRGSA